jgi:outer membrane autotransporter protein
LVRNVSLTVDPSVWNMTESSVLNNLAIANGGVINFVRSGGFKTLTVNNLSGSGTFHMNVDLPAFRGDLLDVQETSSGSYTLVIENQNESDDPKKDKVLLVVRTNDGLANFSGKTVDAGTFEYEVQRGNGKFGTNERNWYLFREDEGGPEGPDTGGGEGGGTGSGPKEPENFPKPVDPVQALTNTANAAIGTYSAVLPMFYADLGTLNERLGELRLQSLPSPARPTPSYTKEARQSRRHLHLPDL